MTHPDNSVESKEQGRDRAIALVALAVEPSPAAAACPTPAELAALLDDPLHAAGREALLAHLAACPLCYEQWLALAAADEEASRHILAGPWHRIWRPGTKKYWFTGLGLALAASLVLLLMPMSKPPAVAKLVAAAYQDVLAQRPVVDGEALRQRLSFPWEAGPAGYGFSPASPASEAARAFAKGLTAGRALLAQETKATGTIPQVAEKLAQWPLGEEWERHGAADYYWLGRWLVLLQYACLVTDFPQAGPFWRQQDKTRERLYADFTGRQEEEAHKAVSGLRTLTVGLAELGRHPEDRRAMRHLLATLAELSRELAPPAPPR